MNRLEARFAALQRERRKGLIVYLGAGDPDLEQTRQLALALDRVGVDVLELGVPFSDPLADGLVNQLAAQRGLASGTTPRGVLDTVASIRKEATLPIVLYLYYNLVHRHGLPEFITDAAAAGVDGLLILDLPPEEGATYEPLMAAAGLCNIYLIAPTTPQDRLAAIVPRSRGFVYYVSREGVTGMQANLAANLAEKVAQIRAHTRLPVAVGFGISNADQARVVAAHADAVVVGSAIVDQVARQASSPDWVPRVAAYVRSLLDAVRSV